MTTINMPRHRLQALLLLLRRTLELISPEEIYRLNKDNLWRFYYNAARVETAEQEYREKPN